MSEHDYWYYLKLADQHWRQGDYESALENFDKAVALRPEEPYIFLRRGDFFCDRSDYPQAILEYGRAINLYPDDYNFYCYRGLAFEEMGAIENAIADFTSAIGLIPNYGNYYYARGRLYMKIMDYIHAEKDFTSAISLIDANEISTFARAIFARAKVSLLLENFDGAIDDLTWIIDKNAEHPERIGAFRLRGQAYFKNRNYAQSITDFTKYLLNSDGYLESDIADAYYNRGFAYRKLNDRTNAILDYQRVLQMNPQGGMCQGF